MDTMAYLKKEQKRIFRLIQALKMPYYLTGGTALAFQLNHRFSEDLDFFSQEYKKDVPAKIMKHVSKETGFTHKLDAEQTDPKLIPMKVYLMELKDEQVLKIDFVQDFTKNIKPIKNGLHSIEDIYYRKICVTLGKKAGVVDDIGRTISVGRQAVKDLLDIYCLSKKLEPLHQFFERYFAAEVFEYVESWYRGFNRMEAKLEMKYYAPKIDPGDVFHYLDREILKKRV